MLKNNLSIFFGIFLVSMMFVPSVSSQEAVIPDWIKNNAGWWADGLIDDGSFVSGIQWANIKWNNDHTINCTGSK